MYRSSLRSTPRIANSLRQSTGIQSTSTAFRTSGRRFASTLPADKRRTWKSSAVRWGLAVGALYWYSTSPAFAEEPHLQTIPPPPQFSDDDLPTVEAVVAQKRREAEQRLQKKTAAASTTEAEPATATLASAAQSPEAPAQDVDTSSSTEAEPSAGFQGGVEGLEEEAGQQGAFNPETGEINWDCPCLGGMADGPCGEQFKAAFSCFVYSKEEPKGMDCIDKFQHMQDCFRLHPEIYGEELEDDEEAQAAVDGVPDGAGEGGPAKSTTSQKTTKPAEAEAKAEAPESASKPDSSKKASENVAPTSSTATDRETGEKIPERSYDATSANSSSPSK